MFNTKFPALGPNFNSTTYIHIDIDVSPSVSLPQSWSPFQTYHPSPHLHHPPHPLASPSLSLSLCSPLFRFLVPIPFYSIYCPSYPIAPIYPSASESCCLLQFNHCLFLHFWTPLLLLSSQSPSLLCIVHPLPSCLHWCNQFRPFVVVFLSPSPE